MIGFRTKMTDSSEAAKRDYRAAARLGVIASAQVVTNAVMRGHTSDYYKGGAFRGTLKVRQSIHYSDPVLVNGEWESRVGTRIIEALYWELGHQNLFTRQFERRRIWEPAMLESIADAQAAFGRTVAARMQGTAPTLPGGSPTVEFSPTGGGEG